MVGCPLSASGAFEDVVLTWAIAEAARVNILTTAKKRQEQSALVFWGRMTRQKDSADESDSIRMWFLRYLLQDDRKQTTLANHIVDHVLSDRNPGFISLVTVFEMVWVCSVVFWSKRLLKSQHILSTFLLQILSEPSLRDSSLSVAFSHSPEGLGIDGEWSGLPGAP
jgi:hypothetical protein